MSDSLWPHGLYSPWNSLGQNTGVGKPFPSPGDLPNPGIEPRSPALQVDSLPQSHQEKWKKLSRVWLFATPWTIPSREFPRPEHWSGVALPFSRLLSNPGVEYRYPALRADSLQSEPLGKPKNTGVGSLSLLQGIFLTQESSRGLLHCTWILYQLSYQGKYSLFIHILSHTKWQVPSFHFIFTTIL